MKVQGVLVLGMHRSGTSAVTGVVSRLGFSANRPDDAVRGPWNPLGHFESQSLMALDNRLLEEMGRTWWYPPPSGAGYAEVAAGIRTSPRQAGRVFHRAYPKRPWVWKDPRACLLVPFWRRVFDDGVVAIVVIRDPLDVASSLARRNETSMGFGVALWERYNRLLLDHVAGLPTLVTRFDDLVADPAGWSKETSEFLRRSGSPVDERLSPDVLAEAVDPGLRHGRPEPASRPSGFDPALELYDAVEHLVGAWANFAPPSPGPEPPYVEQELAAFGLERAPQWRPPPPSEIGVADVPG